MPTDDEQQQEQAVAALLEQLRQSSLYLKIKREAPKILFIYRFFTLLDFPEYDCDLDSHVLENEICRQFAKAVFNLKNECEDKLSEPGFAEGFVQGFVSSALKVHWYGEYIYPKTDEYKKLMLLKSLFSFLDYSHDTADKVEKLFHYLLDKQDAFEASSKEETDNIINFAEYKNKKSQLRSEFSIQLTDYLKSLMMEKHHQYFDKLLLDKHGVKMEHFFSHDEIQALLIQVGIYDKTEAEPADLRCLEKNP